MRAAGRVVDVGVVDVDGPTGEEAGRRSQVLTGVLGQSGVGHEGRLESLTAVTARHPPSTARESDDEPFAQSHVASSSASGLGGAGATLVVAHAPHALSVVRRPPKLSKQALTSS